MADIPAQQTFNKLAEKISRGGSTKDILRALAKASYGLDDARVIKIDGEATHRRIEIEAPTRLNEAVAIVTGNIAQLETSKKSGDMLAIYKNNFSELKTAAFATMDERKTLLNDVQRFIEDMHVSFSHVKKMRDEGQAESVISATLEPLLKKQGELQMRIKGLVTKESAIQGNLDTMRDQSKQSIIDAGLRVPEKGQALQSPGSSKSG